jgi:hypothetical protein
VFLAIRDPAGKRGLLKLSESFRINPTNVPVADLEMLLGPEAVKFWGPVNGHARNGH